MKKENNEEINESKELSVVNKNFEGLADAMSGSSKKHIFTSVQDSKQIFNLEGNCDYKINDYEGEVIRVKDLMLKVYEKETEKEVEKEVETVDQDTGEILTKKVKEKELVPERTVVTILIDEAGKSYVTKSKSFFFRMRNFIDTFGIDQIKEGVDIKITKVPVKNSSNKALSFELVSD